MLTFLLLDGAKLVVVKGDVAVDPLRVGNVKEVGDEHLEPAVYGEQGFGTGHVFDLQVADGCWYFPFQDVVPTNVVELLGQVAQTWWDVGEVRKADATPPAEVVEEQVRELLVGVGPGQP
jgi:hypothetical protein